MEDYVKLKMNPDTQIGSGMDYYSVLLLIQDELTKKYSELFTDSGVYDSSSNAIEAKKEKINNLITKYILTHKITVPEMTDRELCSRIYDEMVNYSVLTPYIEDANNEIEEINVNAWNDIEVRYSNGSVIKAPHFCNIDHAKNVIKRLASVSGSQIDDAMPMAEGNLRNNVRLVVLQSPIVDEDVGVAASIRLLKPQFSSRDFFIKNGTVSEEEMTFLETAINTGISMVFVGETGSGKTTLMNYLLTTIPNRKRIVTIEHNARELSLVKKNDKGEIVNNVVHMQTRPHEKDNLDISQEDLVAKALRLDPNNICVGEMRDSEAYAAQEASLTGHTVVTSLHARGISATHFRIAMLALKKYPIDISIALMQAAMAFPVVVYISHLADNSRRVMEIAECNLLEDNNDIYRIYTTLYQYKINSTVIKNGKTIIDGKHIFANEISDDLKKTMEIHGATIEQFESIKKRGE